MSSSPHLDALRATLFEGSRDLYMHIGYFITWFSAVENHLTFLLAVILKQKNMVGFELLVRGMDARVKCERLRSACKTARPLGPNLKPRLAHFENNSIPLRNKLTHSMTVMPEDSDELHFTSRMPFAAFGFAQLGEPPEKMTTLSLFEAGLWLNLFATDLIAITQGGFDGEILEIADPHSPLLPADHEGRQSKVALANPRKPAQKPSGTE